MSGEHPALQFVSDGEFKLIDQHVEASSPELHSGCEVVTVRGPAGETAELTYDIPPAPVITELILSTTIMSNRRGVQIAARVCLPRCIDSDTGTMRQLLVRGSNLGEGNQPSNLKLQDLRTHLERQARVTRLRTKDVIDTHEAYIRQLVFLVPGGRGNTTVAVDRIEIHGVLRDRIMDSQVLAAQATLDEKVSPAQYVGNFSTNLAKAARVHRIIRWQGEPFDYLADLGFNGIWLDHVPSRDDLNQANDLGLSIVCPPPNSKSELPAKGPQADPWAAVLAWHLGDSLSADGVKDVLRIKRKIGLLDPVARRPTLLSCDVLPRDVSRISDTLLLERESLGSDLTLREYVIWLRQRQRLARPGTPVWCSVETHLSPQRSRQIAAWEQLDDEIYPSASFEQLCSLTTAGIAIKCCNYLFTSLAPLNATDVESKLRSMNLKLLNLRMQLLEPWLVSGKKTSAARCSNPGISALLLQAERSHLLVPTSWSRDFISRRTIPYQGPVSFMVPGIAETANVYLISLASIQRVPHERTAGGVRITLDDLPSDAVILLSSDPQTFSQVSMFLRRVAPRATKLKRDVTALRLTQLANAIGPPLSTRSPAWKSVELAHLELAECDRHLQKSNVELAFQRVLAAERTLAQAEYYLRNWQRTPAGQSLTPLEFSAHTLPLADQLHDAISHGSFGPDLLQAGEFEDLTAMLTIGWRLHQLPGSGVSSAARLSPQAPHRGTYCLELQCTPEDPEQPVSVVPTAPIWITSEPVSVDEGDVIEITGVARVPEELIGTVDGLQIIDSLGGAGMATKIQRSPSWQPFRILRKADTTTTLTISIALTGLGRAQVDSLSVRKVSLPSVALVLKGARNASK